MEKIRSRRRRSVEKDFVKISALGLVEIGLVEGVGCTTGALAGVATAAFRMGRRAPLRGGERRGDVGLSGSLAGRDTTPCDWGGARVSGRGQS